MGQGLYVEIWQSLLSFILDGIRKGGFNQPLKEEVFKQVGNRQSYRFRMEFDNSGRIAENRSSAVYRDLKQVLEQSVEFRKLAKTLPDGKIVVIRLGSDFCLHAYYESVTKL